MVTTTKSGATASRTPNLTSARFTKKAMPTYNSSEWVVFEKASNGSTKSPRIYPSAATRDNVRVAYARQTGASFPSTRAVRVSTFKNRLKRGK